MLFPRAFCRNGVLCAGHRGRHPDHPGDAAFSFNHHLPSGKIITDRSSSAILGGRKSYFILERIGGIDV